MFLLGSYFFVGTNFCFLAVASEKSENRQDWQFFISSRYFCSVCSLSGWVMGHLSIEIWSCIVFDFWDFFGRIVRSQTRHVRIHQTFQLKVTRYLEKSPPKRGKKLRQLSWKNQKRAIGWEIMKQNSHKSWKETKIEYSDEQSKLLPKEIFH